MKVKTTIRYASFRPSDNGGRIFDFWISESEQPERAISVEIPVAFFEGQDRLHLQEGVGISYSKVRQFLEVGALWETPLKLCLNAADVALHREVAPSAARRRG